MRGWSSVSNWFLKPVSFDRTAAAFSFLPCHRGIHGRLLSTADEKEAQDALSSILGRAIENDYAEIRNQYRQCTCTFALLRIFLTKSESPKNPIVLAHGLLGFDEFHLGGKFFPAIHYWRGITEALTANGIEVIIASVPASASIEDRAARLSTEIENKAGGKSVNIIA